MKLLFIKVDKNSSLILVVNKWNTLDLFVKTHNIVPQQAINYIKLFAYILTYNANNNTSTNNKFIILISLLCNFIIKFGILSCYYYIINFIYKSWCLNNKDR